MRGENCSEIYLPWDVSPFFLFFSSVMFIFSAFCIFRFLFITLFVPQLLDGFGLLPSLWKDLREFDSISVSRKKINRIVKFLVEPSNPSSKAGYPIHKTFLLCIPLFKKRGERLSEEAVMRELGEMEMEKYDCIIQNSVFSLSVRCLITDANMHMITILRLCIFHWISLWPTFLKAFLKIDQIRLSDHSPSFCVKLNVDWPLLTGKV